MRKFFKYKCHLFPRASTPNLRRGFGVDALRNKYEFQHLLSERLTSLGIIGEPRVAPLNPSETIVL